MIYPKNFEQKIGFQEIRNLLYERCLSTLGKDKVSDMAMSSDAHTINIYMKEISEFRTLTNQDDDFPLLYFFDLRLPLNRIKIEGTHFEEQELFDLYRSLDTIHKIVGFLNRTKSNEEYLAADEDLPYIYPQLQKLTLAINTFPDVIQRIQLLIDKYGHIKDNASPKLLQIRRELSATEGSVSKILHNILKRAQQEGFVDKEVTPTMRDGRLVIPIQPGFKRKISGIIHDESASGKTIFVEPTEAVEANNKIRELEAEERREIIRILSDFSKEIRPYAQEMIESYQILAEIDFIRAKAQLAEYIKGIEPDVSDKPHIDWGQAIHPLLQITLSKQGKKVVPLDIRLDEDKRILIISGPNAGGKSVCLKTVALLQYMVQCGLSIPIYETSQVGIFEHIMIDIGDEQSIENDLSTYSSHLLNMKNMMKSANGKSLILIDEFGSGTEPQIGGAIAEAILKQFCQKRTLGVITTHYQNLKHFAESTPHVVNGAMLYDRQGMKALFQLSIGQPGSSFAIEIARKTGIPEKIIEDASQIVGEDYIQSDKYLQDIVRDKRYWENKRQNIHKKEKDMRVVIEKYEKDIEELTKTRKDIIRKAKEQAEELLRESNKRIETTIKEIKEAQAEKERTKKIREELNAFKENVSQVDSTADDDFIARKIEQIKRRKERHEKHKQEKSEREKKIAQRIRESVSEKSDSQVIQVGQQVRMKGLTTIGTVEDIDNAGTATVVFGGMRSKISLLKLEKAEMNKVESINKTYISKETRQTIDSRRSQFKQDLDVRGMRGDEALNAVLHFIDDAILVGISRVRILHGKGNGILRQLIRQYLSTIPNVTSYKDEHVQFGGAGITVVDL